MIITFEIPDETFNLLVDSVCGVDGWVEREGGPTKLEFVKQRLLDDWAFRKITLAKVDQAKNEALTTFNQTKAGIVQSINVTVQE